MNGKSIFILLITPVLSWSALRAQQAYAGEDVYLTTPISNTVMNANAAVFPNTGAWNLICGNVTLTDVNSPSTAVLGVQYGANFLVWNIYNVVLQLTSSDTVIVFLDDLAQPIDCGSQVEFCVAPPSYNLVSNNTPLGTVNWEVIGGSATISDPMADEIIITDLVPGTTIIKETRTEVCLTNECIHSIFVSENSFVYAGEDQSTFDCLSDELALDGSIPMYGAIGTWTQLSGFESVQLSDIHDPHAQILEEFSGAALLQWQIENVGPCSGNLASDVVEITSFPEDPYLPEAGPDQTVCQNSTQLQANFGFSLSLDSYWSVVQGSGQISDAFVYNPYATGLSIGENIFRVNTILTCSPPIHSDVSIFYIGTLPLDAGPDLSVCFGETIQLNAVLTPAIGESFTWNPTTGLSSSISANPVASPISTTVYNVTATWGDGCSASDGVTVFVFPTPAVDAGIDTLVCISNEPIIFTGYPTNGLWSGASITTDGVFMPAMVGEFEITYTSVSLFGCVASDIKIVSVAPSGCTDPSACNYDTQAICDNDSCMYPLPGQTDCFVLEDLLDLIDNFGCIAMPECAEYDLDGDGIVGVSDLMIIMSQL